MNPKIVDLLELFRVWAWTYYLNTSTGFFARLFRPKLKYKYADIEIKWENVKTTVLETQYKIHSDKQSGTKVVIESEYDNATENDQTHSFKSEQDTISTASIKLTKGYSKHANTGIEMDLPEEMSRMNAAEESPTARKKQMATASFGNSIRVGTDENSVVSRRKTWSVDTTISSKSGKLTKAQLEVEETSATYEFSSAIKLKGRVVAVIRDRRNMEKVVQVVENDVATILNDINDRNEGRMGNFRFDMDNRTVQLPLEGTVTFRYGVSQRVKVSYGTDDGQRTDEARNQITPRSNMYPRIQLEDV